MALQTLMWLGLQSVEFFYRVPVQPQPQSGHCRHFSLMIASKTDLSILVTRQRTSSTCPSSDSFYSVCFCPSLPLPSPQHVCNL